MAGLDPLSSTRTICLGSKSAWPARPRRARRSRSAFFVSSPGRARPATASPRQPAGRWLCASGGRGQRVARRAWWPTARATPTGRWDRRTGPRGPWRLCSACKAWPPRQRPSQRVKVAKPTPKSVATSGLRATCGDHRCHRPLAQLRRVRLCRPPTSYTSTFLKRGVGLPLRGNPILGRPAALRPVYSNAAAARSCPSSSSTMRWMCRYSW